MNVCSRQHGDWLRFRIWRVHMRTLTAGIKSLLEVCRVTVMLKGEPSGPVREVLATVLGSSFISLPVPAPENNTRTATAEAPGSEQESECLCQCSNYFRITFYPVQRHSGKHNPASSQQTGNDPCLFLLHHALLERSCESTALEKAAWWKKML